MPTKAVTNRQKKAQAMIAAGETHLPVMVEQIGTCVQPYLKRNQKAPETGSLLGGMLGMLASRCDAMVAADEAHERELGDDTAPRDARDRAASELTSTLVQLREMAQGLYGAGSLKSLGFTRAVPKDPVVLGRYAGEISETIRGATLPKTRIKGAQWDKADVADAISEKRTALQSALKEVAKEVREAQASLEAKNLAIAAFDQAYVGVAEVISGMLRLSGKVELAEKLWPTTRRSAEVLGEEEAELKDGAAPTN